MTPFRPAFRRMPLLAVSVLSACGGPEGGSASAGGLPVAAADLHCWIREGSPPSSERPSPLGETVLTLGDWHGKLCYGRPSARERQVAGGLVPYGEPWRLGANEATTLLVPFPARIGSVAVAPGAYTLYVTAGEGAWRVFVNGATERWGVPISEEVRSADVGSFDAPVTTLEEPVETLTASWANRSDRAGDLAFEWGDMRVVIPVERVEG